MTLPVATTATLRILRPAPNVLAFYDGRVDGQRLGPAGPNWLDDGAYGLGVATYAIVSGDEALVYDTHVSVSHGEWIRAALVAEGVTRIRVVLSHWHLDHVAGNAAFADCEIIAHRWTLDALTQHRAAIETGSHHGEPAIRPLLLPTTIYDDALSLEVGDLAVELRHFDIHSRDATVLWLPQQALLLAGDTVEDTVTYVSEPSGLAVHLGELNRLDSLGAERILPNHGDPDLIASGGYPRTLIRATQQYLRTLLRMPADTDLQEKPLQELIAGPILAGWVRFYAPYEAVHRQNIAVVLAHGESGTT